MTGFPLVHPALRISFLVTMWDTPESNTSSGLLSSIGSAVLSAASAFVMGGFAEVEGLEAVNVLEAHSEGGDALSQRRFFTRATYPKIVMRRGVTFNTDIWDWHHQVVVGKRKSRKNGTITLFDTKKLTDAPVVSAIARVPVAAWTFTDALPSKLTGPTLNARRGEGQDAVAIESLELQPQKIERMSISLVPGVADLNSALGALAGAGTAAVAGGAAALL
jgi:phage tail-like protein